MNVLIAEDEILAAERLQELLQQCAPDAVVLDHVDSVTEAVAFLKKAKSIDLLLLDIQLADGKSFEIFEKVEIDVPVIFTTAYDQYAIHAFKFHSIDYLLKPIQQDDLRQALTKLRKLSTAKGSGSIDINALKELLNKTYKPYKERFMIKTGNKLQYKPSSEIAYFFAEGKEAYLVTKTENKKFLIDHTLEDLESLLNPSEFFRISRKFILHVESIREIKGSHSTRLEVKLFQVCEHDLSVSRDRAQDFKAWLDR
jgi:DNA-binding LytR/AlgR family response regulator